MTFRRTVLIVYLVVVGLAVFLLARDEAAIKDRLGPPDKVQVVGPCRTFGPDHPECKRQAKLIFESCIRHDLHPACTLARVALERPQDARPNRTLRKGAASRSPGGDASSSPPPASSQPGPPQGGPPSNPPPDPPAPPPKDPPGLLDPVCDLDLPVNAC